jgi:hypothetical protein
MRSIIRTLRGPSVVGKTYTRRRRFGLRCTDFISIKGSGGRVLNNAHACKTHKSEE